VNIKKNDLIELQITDLNNLGCGVGKTDDGVWSSSRERSRATRCLQK